MSASKERVPVIVVEDYDDIARLIARRIEALIRTRAAAGEPAVLGLATGSTPIGIYRELIRLHQEEGLDFSNVVTFNLDEYYPMPPASIHSYRRYMGENFFDHVNIPSSSIHLLPGDVLREDVDTVCREYETAIQRVGGIDFQILGIGKTGHIGFNEPGSARGSRTRLVHLDTITRKDAAADFFGEENVPREAITMGVGTILEAEEIALIATGEHKARIVRRAAEGEVSHEVAATYLQSHPNARFYVDAAAAADLTRIAAPWLVRDCDWTPALAERAVIWLSGVTGTPLLKLSSVEYRENHLSSLLARHPSVDALNRTVFQRLADRLAAGGRLPHGRRIVVFSPHPDDDVISMGGTLRKLHEGGNEIAVAYMTSGNIAVFDHEVRRYLDFMQRLDRDLGVLGGERLADFAATVERALGDKQPGDVDIHEVQELKREIREAEAVSAVESLGIRRDACHFLNLPFYRTGKVRKDPVSGEDVEIVLRLLQEIRPEVVFVAGDLSDPHGTHRQCKQAVEGALQVWGGPAPEVWLYRGAWQEWSVEEADVFVPVSRDELKRKIMAIFKHQSQKDVAPFPGPYDDREFWQRVEARNTATAAALDRLGLPEYHALEAFVVRRPGADRDTEA